MSPLAALATATITAGKWAVHEVSFNVAPYPLTSEEAVLAAEQAGDVTVVRKPGNDFKCPIQGR